MKAQPATDVQLASEDSVACVRTFVSGGVIHFMLLTLCLCATSYLHEYPAVFSPIVILMLLTTVLRVAFTYRFVQYSKENRRSARIRLGIATIMSGLTWSGFCCAVAVLTPEASVFPLLVMITIILGGSEAIALFPETDICCAYVIALVSPIAAWGIVHGHMLGYGVFAILGLYLIYLLRQVTERSSQKKAFIVPEAVAVPNTDVKQPATQPQYSNRTGALHGKNDSWAGIGRELRTPIYTISGAIELLRGSALGNEHRDLLHTLHQSSERLAATLDEIFDMSQIQTGELVTELTQFDLQALVRESAGLVANEGQKPVTVDWSTALKLPTTLTGDARRLRRILWNVLAHAATFAGESEISLRVECIGTYGLTKTVRFAVSLVNASSDVAKMFCEIMQANSSNGPDPDSQGLGLALSKPLVLLMGGQIGFEDIPATRPTIWFTLPFRAPEEFIDHSTVDLAGMRVLLVGENALSRRVLNYQLTSLGAKVGHALGVQEALGELESACREANDYHFVFVDQHLEQIGGGLSARIRSRTQFDDLALVLMKSGSSVSADELRTAGFASSIAKPIRLTDLRECLHAVLRASPKLLPTVGVKATEVPMAGARILLADDNASNQKILKRMLEKLGYYVDIAGDGRAAVEKFDRGLYDAVLMDCQMPEMDGYTAVREIRAREAGRHRTVILALTASTMGGEREKCLSSGMDDYLTKPIRTNELQRVLQRHLASRPPSAVAKPAEITNIMPLKSLEHEIGVPAMREILQEFLTESSMQIERLHKISVEADSETAVKLLNNLLESSTSVGLTALSQPCTQLKMAARNYLQHEYESLLPHLASAHEGERAELEQFFMGKV